MKMRVSAVQYHLHTIHSFEEFAKQVEHYVHIAEEYESEFVLFPELFTTQLMSIGDENGQPLPIEALPGYTEAYVDLFKGLAMKTGMHLIGEHMLPPSRESCLTRPIYFIRMDV